MKKIFISYSRDDGADLANYVIVHYEREGHQIFKVRDDIELGDDWPERIKNSISDSDIVVVIVTRSALRSLEVEKEVEEAKRQKKMILPCVYKGIPWVKLKWDLNKLQGFDFDNKNSLVRQLDEMVFENKSPIKNQLETEKAALSISKKSLGWPNIFSKLRDSIGKRLRKEPIDDTIDNSDIRLQEQGSEQPLPEMKRNQNEVKEPGSKAGEQTGGTGVDQEPGVLSPPTSTVKSEQNSKITRFPCARFPQKVVVEEVVPLEIVIKATKPQSLNKTNTSIQLRAKPDEPEIPVLVTVELTAGFELVGKEYYAILSVPVGVEDSKPVIFRFKAKEEGNQNITIRFYQQQTYVGQIKINTEIERSRDELHTKSPTTSQLKDWNLGVLPEKTPRGPDVTIYIQERRVSPDFEYGVLISSNEYAIKEMGPIKFSFNPETKFQKLFQDIENMNMAADVVDQKIRNKGMTLYDELFPAQLKDLYWEKKDRIRSIRVLSKEPWIPWEIIRPWRQLDDGTIKEDEFLCERFSFSRWLVDGPDRIREQLRKVKIIVPSDTNLPKAIEEQQWIQQFGNKKGLDISYGSTYQDVINTFQTGGFDLLHFSTHGQKDNDSPLLSVIELENRVQLRPEDIAGAARNFGRTSPFVILNACQSANQGFSLTGVQGWATRFLDAGTSVFIGTQWSVSDEIAYQFVQELYTQLSIGTALGEAVRIARNKCKRSGDPSWLAYQLYGHPNIVVSFGDI